MRFLFLSLVAVSVYGQVQRPPGFVRGVVTSNTSAAFAVRTSTGSVYQYRTDSKTWIERDRERVRAASLQPGEILEVVSDRDLEPVRYARMIHVIEPVRVKPLPVSTGGVYRLKPAAPLVTGVYVGLVVERERDRITCARGSMGIRRSSCRRILSACGMGIRWMRIWCCRLHACMLWRLEMAIGS